MSAAQVDNALRNYIAAGQYRFYAIPAPARISEKNYSMRTADLRRCSGSPGRYPSAFSRLPRQGHRRIPGDPEIGSQPSSGLPCPWLCILEKQDFTQAAEYFKRSSEQDSNDPRVHYYNALLMARKSGFSPRADIPALTKELETSIRLDPNFADSYAMLAFAQSTSGDHAKALETMRRAIAINPRNENYRFNLANIYLAKREPDEALAILESLQQTLNPEMAAQVAAAIQNVREFHRVRASEAA